MDMELTDPSHALNRFWEKEFLLGTVRALEDHTWMAIARASVIGY